MVSSDDTFNEWFDTTTLKDTTDTTAGWDGTGSLYMASGNDAVSTLVYLDTGSIVNARFKIGDIGSSATSAPTLVTDSVGDNTGSIYGATWTASGKYGGAFNFTGSPGYLEIVSGTNIPQAAEDFTVAAWVKPTDYTNEGAGDNLNVVNWGNGAEKEARIFGMVSNGTLEMAFYAYDFNTGSTVPSGTWTHVACTLANGSVLNMYQDGNVTRTDTDLTGINTTRNTIRIARGVYGFDNFFNGLIDDVRIYGRALNAGEIGSVKDNAGSFGPFISHYEFSAVGNGGPGVDLFLSTNSGTNWEEVNSGSIHDFTTTGSELRWKLSARNVTNLSGLTIEYNI